MAAVKQTSQDDESFAYVVLHNGMDTLLSEIDKFCKGEYGRTCDLYQAYIARREPSNYTQKVHEFEGVGADMLEKVRNHVKQERDYVKFKFSSGDTEFAIDIVPGTHSEYLTKRMQREDVDELTETDTVVLVETTADNEVKEAIQFLENL